MKGDQRFYTARKEAFDRWCMDLAIPGLGGEIFSGVFDNILRKQSPSGEWKTEDKEYWTPVQTAVVLKSLALLKYGATDTWSLSEHEDEHLGGIGKAVQFLCNETVAKKGSIVGEDIWDTCQVLQALHAFGKEEIGKAHADMINAGWEVLYEAATAPAQINRWTGPAYLAAMAEVLGIYRNSLAHNSNLPTLLNALGAAERKDNAGAGSGVFPDLNNQINETRWNTSLVLRAMCTLPIGERKLLDSELVERIVEYLTQELAKYMTWSLNPSEGPMFLARCLDGLQAAMQRVSAPLQPQVADALHSGNKHLDSIWHKGDLKAYTAMAEYLAAVTASVPAGLVFDVGPKLTEAMKRAAVPQDIHGGYRLMWLSDLHISGENHEQPWTMNMVPGWLSGMKYIKGNPLTQHFQETNLREILNRVVELQPDHILITGDITNYAKPEQFQKARDLLLETQARLLPGSVIGRLTSDLWTILPGNHDVTDKSRAAGQVRRNLGLFFSYFNDLYGEGRNGYDDLFPISRGRGRSRKFRLIVLDSNVEWPVWVVGFNARGRIDQAQIDRLSRMLSTSTPLELVIVALHHHPMVVPDMVSDVEDHFLSLEEATGRKLVSLCATTGVAAILHGHFHRFSRWTGRVHNGSREISIIGSPAGTMDIRGMSNEFLEWCEARLETGGNVRTGLALYRHANREDQWTREYQDVFIS